LELKNNLHTESGWEIAERAFDPDQMVTTGSNFMVGNGYIGYRGTFAECDKARYVACIVSDTYDMADGRQRELCNVPNGLFTQLYVDGELMSAFAGETSDYRRALNVRHGVYSRSQTWRGRDGQGVRVETERFASADNVHLIAMRYSFRPEQDGEITVVTGIDGQVWSLSGEHFKAYSPFTEDALIGMETITGEFGIQIDVVEGISIAGAQPRVEMVQESRRILRRLTFSLKANEDVSLEKVVAIYTSNDVSRPRERAVSAAQAAKSTGYGALREAHQARWDEIWEMCDIQIEGNLEDQTTTRFNLYHNIIATPRHADLPIGARGLSCQVYQGAAFWDQEIFNMPMYLYTQPEVARSILKYRHDTLDGARGKAKRLGYYGAFYAWTSGKTGEELFPDHFFTNVLTGRKVRNHFNDWQIHISPDIVYALWQYYVATADWDFIVSHGAEIAFEVAQFLVSRVHFKVDKDRYEFIRLLGPDEYHENVDNNAFTHYQARFALETALTIYERMVECAPEELSALVARLGLSEEDVASWQDIVDRIYVPQPDAETLLFEQFDGYFDLEDVRPDDLRERLLDPEEYWGWPNGVAVETQVLKQADVLQLLALHRELFPVEVMRANYDYYEPRTEHGSSLSPSVHAIVASRVGYIDEAYAYFRVGSTIDLYNASKKVMSGGSFLGGIHTAACGAVWQVIVQGFAGLEVAEDGTISLAPALPRPWDSVAFKLMVQRSLAQVKIAADSVIVTADGGNGEAIKVTVSGQMELVAPGETRRLVRGST
jgi:kojibiose phosphorylase